MNQENPDQINLSFTTILSNGEQVNLKPGSVAEAVTADNVSEYIDLVMKTRFKESKEQIKAMQSGMLSVMGPNLMQFLRLLDWEHLESRVCGEKTVDVDKLKSITRY